MVEDTSLSAYEIAKSKLSDCQMMVFNFIADHPRVCDKEISEGLRWEINRVTNRRGELVKSLLVLPAGKKINASGRVVNCWRANEWARRYPSSGKAMPSHNKKVSTPQMTMPGIVNSWDL